MGLYDGRWAVAAERRCREDALREKVARGLEGGEVRVAQPAATPQAVQAETAGAAIARVETAATNRGVGIVLAAAGRLFRGNGKER